MDRTSIAVLVACFLLLMVWFPILNHFYPPIESKPGTNLVEQIRSKPATNFADLTAKTPSATNPAAIGPSQTTLPTATPSQPEETIILENELARYTFTSHGGGLKQVQLKLHQEAVGSDRLNKANTNLATLNRHASLPAVMSILAMDGAQADGVYQLQKIAPQTLRAEKVLTNGIVWAKQFRLSSNYLVEATITVENRGNQTLSVAPQEWIIGTATPLSARDQNTLLRGAIEYNGQKAEYINETWFANRTLGCLPGVPRTAFTSGTNVIWGAVHNQFFALAVIPKEPAPGMLAKRVDLPAPTPAELAADNKLEARPFGFQASLVYPTMELAPQQKVERMFHIFAGPKEYNSLARLGAEMKNDLDLLMNLGGFWGFFAKMLLLSMNGLHALGLSYGWTIIGITVIIKLLFWPLTNSSTRSMKRMAALQPQMKALQEKYKDDPKKMNLKLMEFMKEHKVSPAAGCLPMLLQIPVFFGFYTMLQSAIELRGARFLWASDLSTADTIGMLPGLNFPINPMPLIMGVTMIWQARMTPPTPGADPTQQKIMKYMPLMFMVFLYNFSAGLTLYWTVQNLLSIAQMKMTKTDSAEVSTNHPSAGSKKTGFPGSRKLKP